jgi:hypothetical protein
MVREIITATIMNTTNGRIAATLLAQSEPGGFRGANLTSSTESAIARTLGPRPPYQADSATARTKNRKRGVGVERLSPNVTAEATRVATMASKYAEA